MKKAVNFFIDICYSICYTLVSMDIRKMRKRLNFTQEQLAQKLGVSFTTVNRWEKGKNEPSPLALRALKELENEIK